MQSPNVTHNAPARTAGAFCFHLTVCLISFLFVACSTPSTTHTTWKPVISLLEQRQHHVVIQQWDLSCGAAAIATLLNYQYGLSLSEKQIAESMLSRTHPLTVRIQGGFSLLDLKRYAQSQGFQGKAYQNLGFMHLLALQPAIVPVNLGDYNHFVLFRGAVGDLVLLADPAFGNRSISRQKFERGWLGHIAFIVKRPDYLAPSNQLGIEAIDFIRVPSAVIRQAFN